MAAPRQALNPATNSVGFTAKLVTVRSVSEDGKTAVCVDRLNTQTSVSMLVQRGKGPLPAPGETWLLTQDLGMWSFAAIVASSSGQFISGPASSAGTRVTVSATSPTSAATGDIWVSGASDNAVLWWSGMGWVPAQFGTQAIADGAVTRPKISPGAVSAAEIDPHAGITAGQVAFSVTEIGGVRIFMGTSQPPDPAQGDLWISPDQGNALYFWDGGRWTGLLFGAEAIVPASLTTFQISPDAGITGGQVDFTARDIGGITTSVSSFQPTNPAVGDLWFDGTSSYVLRQWSGSAWLPYQFGTQAIQAASVTAALIAANTITAAQIAAGTITATEIAAGIILAGVVDGTIITGAQFIAHGSAGEILAYAGTPAAGNLIESVNAVSSTDSHGNVSLGGQTTYTNAGAGDFSAINIDGQRISYLVNTISGVMSGWVQSAQIQFIGSTATDGAIALIAELGASVTGGFFGIGSSLARVQWIFPSGDTSGVADAAAINFALGSGNQVMLIPGTYYVNAPVSVPSHGFLLGPPIMRKATYGAVIKPVAGFSGGSGVIQLATGGDGYVIDGVSVDGTLYVAGALHGIYASGSAHSAIIRHCGIRAMTGDGMHTSRSGGNVPFSWQVEDVESANNGGSGYYLTDMTDTSWVSCRAVSNGADGWTTNPSDAPGANSRFVECISEGNSGYGWNIQGNTSTMAILLSACSTQFNDKSGLLIATSAAVSAFIQVAGCRFWEDGVAGGGGTNYSGIEVSGTTGPVGLMISGTSVQTQNTGSPSHPQYGLSITNCGGHCRVSGSLLIGGSAAYHDGGGNTSVVIDGTTGQATGPLSGLTWTVA